jgi:hypothetical protein
MSEVTKGYIVFVCFMALLFGLWALLFGLWVGRVVQERTMVNWTESCWPNKPVWTAGFGHCWINGQKVLVDMEN